MLHTPKRSNKNFKEISKHLSGFVDNSWGNDEVDSIYREEDEISIYFPNSDKDDFEQEYWSHFCVSHFIPKGKDDWTEVREIFHTIKELVEYIKTISK